MLAIALRTICNISSSLPSADESEDRLYRRQGLSLSVSGKARYEMGRGRPQAEFQP